MKQGKVPHNKPLKEDVMRRAEAIPQKAKLSSVVIIRRLGWNLLKSPELSHKNSGKKFYGLLRPNFNSAKVMKRQMKALLMVQTTQHTLTRLNHSVSSQNKRTGLIILILLEGTVCFHIPLSHNISCVKRFNSKKHLKSARTLLAKCY